MTSQGSAHGRFTHAIKSGNLWAAEIAARELGSLTLYDALDLCVLLARDATKPAKFERAAIRWHGRLELEAQTLTLRQSETALALLATLPEDSEAVRLLQRLLRRARTTLMRRMP